MQALPRHQQNLGSLRYMRGGDAWTLHSYMERWRTTGLLVIKDGAIAFESYRMGNGPESRWCSFSMAKSLTASLVGGALHDGSLDTLDRRVETLVPQLVGSAYAGTTIRHLLRMSSGIRWSEDAADPNSDLGLFSALVLAGKKGGPMDLMRTRPRLWAAGTHWNYNTGESFVLGAAVMAATGVPLATYLSKKIWSQVGMEADAYWALDGEDGTELGGASFSATLRDYGRLGLLVLQDGQHGAQRILPAGWRDRAGRPETALTAPGAVLGDYPLGYGYHWWTFADSTAFEAQGLYGQHMLIHPEEQLVIVVWSAWTQPGSFQAEKETWSMFAAVAAALR